MPYRLSPLAEHDLFELWSYVADEASEERADGVIDAIVEALEFLSQHPRAGRRRPDLGGGVRSFPAANHLIYYRVTEMVSVARILHARRDQRAAWQSSDENG